MYGALKIARAASDIFLIQASINHLLAVGVIDRVYPEQLIKCRRRLNIKKHNRMAMARYQWDFKAISRDKN